MKSKRDILSEKERVKHGIAEADATVQALKEQLETVGQVAELYDADGNRVEAKIVRMPTEKSAGMAIMPGGERKEIAHITTLMTMLRDGRALMEQEEDEAEPIEPIPEEKMSALQAKYRKMLYLRKDGRQSFVEMLASGLWKRE